MTTNLPDVAEHSAAEAKHGTEMIGIRNNTERKWAEAGQRLSQQFLAVANQYTDTDSLLNNLVGEVQKFTGCAAVGIRVLNEKGGIPYEAYVGFPQSFYESESPLSIKTDRCMCINVIRGETDAKLPFYTPGGSFYINGTTRFLATVSEEEKGQTRNACNQAGYESVALVPIHLQNDVLALIHVADPRENMVPVEMVEVLEDLATHMGAAFKRVQAERALRESEQRYRQLLEAVTTYTYSVELENGVAVSSTHSPGYSAATGYTPEEFAADPDLWMNMIHPDDREMVRRYVADVLATENVLPIEHRIVHKGGTVRWVRDTVVQHYNDSAELVRYDGVVEDITERKQAEQALATAQSRLEHLVSSSPAVIYSCNTSGDYCATFVSKNVKKELGHEPHQFTEDPGFWVNHIHADDRQRVLDGLHYLHEHGYHTSEYRFRNKEGTYRQVCDAVRLVRAPESNVDEAVGYMIDITERKQAEEQIVRQNAIMTAVNEVFERALVCDSSEEVAQTCLVVAAKLTGSKFGFIGELNQAGLFDTIAMSDPGWDACKMPESDAMRLAKNMKIRGYHKAALRDGESRIVNDPASHPDGVGTPEGHPPITCFLGVPLKHGDETIGMIGLANKESGYGLTDKQAVETLSVSFVEALMHKEAEEALRQTEEELRQSQKLEAVGQLAGGVAHEFNNLLQAIGGYTKYAMEGLPPEGQPYRDLQQVEKAAGRAATLTRQLLGFGRRETLEPRDLRLNEVVTDVLKMLRPLIGEQIEVKTVLDGKVGTVHADPTLIEQILLNLCINARDAMPSGGALTIETRDLLLSDAYCKTHVDIKPGRHVQITVSDTGCGMAPEVVEHIFDPFYTTKEVGKGTGLGLAMVYGVVKQHGGDIHVYSEPGLGTNFKVFLPTVQKAVCSDDGEGSETVPGGTETILVAEDEPLVRDLAVRILTDAGYSVLPASDGEEALYVFQTNANTISLALLDLVMPKMNGRMVYQGIQTLNPETKVLFCSGYDADANCGGFVAREGLQCVKKPFDSNELLRSVRETLDAEPACQTIQTTG